MLVRILYFFSFRTNLNLVELNKLEDSYIYVSLNKFFENVITTPYLLVSSKLTSIILKNQSDLLSKYHLLLEKAAIIFNSSFIEDIFGSNKFIFNFKISSKYYYFDLVKTIFLGKTLFVYFLNSRNFLFTFRYFNDFLNVIQ